jgi:hypothetical protein
MAAKGGKRYPLLLYARIMEHWWPATFTLGLILWLNVAVLWGAEWYFTDPAKNPLMKLPTEAGVALLGIGGLAMVVTVFLSSARRMAYVQFFDNYMRLVTPFLGLNISYKRIQRTSMATMGSLFQSHKLSEWQRDTIAPIAANTSTIIHLTAYPISRRILDLFLSPYFFYDKTPHFIITVTDWMAFNQELDSRRTGKKYAPAAPAPRPVSAPAPRPRKPASSSGLLDDLKKK